MSWTRLAVATSSAQTWGTLAGRAVDGSGAVVPGVTISVRHLERGIERAIANKTVTYDLARQMEGATELKTSKFADAIISNM